MPTSKELDLSEPLVGQLMEFVPSPLKPYAKALVAAVPPLLTAWGVLQSGEVTVVTVIQFIISVLTVGGIYLVPLSSGKWESKAKTIVAAVGAVLAAAVAGFGDGGAAGWLGFGSAALAAVLVEVVDNVPNARPAVATATQVAQDVLNRYEVGISGPTVSLPSATNVSYSTGSPVSASPVPPAPPLPDAKDVDPEG